MAVSRMKSLPMQDSLAIKGCLSKEKSARCESKAKLYIEAVVEFSQTGDQKKTAPSNGGAHKKSQFNK